MTTNPVVGTSYEATHTRFPRDDGTYSHDRMNEWAVAIQTAILEHPAGVAGFAFDLAELLQVLVNDADTAYDVGTGFSCTEIEALAGLYDLTGQPEEAMLWRRGHAQGDDEGDQHNEDGTIRPDTEDGE